jgi:hypothetical protein
MRPSSHALFGNRTGMLLVGLVMLTGCGPIGSPPFEPSGSPQQASDSNPIKSLAEASPADPPSIDSSNRRSDSPVAISMQFEPDQPRAGEPFVVSLNLQIAAPFEIQAVGEPPPKIATQLEMLLPDGFTAPAAWETPLASRSFAADGHSVYQGTVTFRRTVHPHESVAPGSYMIRCRVRFQACDERRCLRPEEPLLERAVQIQPAA